MLPDSHPLINSITQPFAGDVEMKLSARQILEEKFEPEHPSVAKMIEHFEKKDGRKFSLFVKSAIWILALVALGFGVYQERFMIWTAEIYQSFHDFEAPTPSPQKGLSEKDQLLLGDPKLDELTQKRMLFESDQTNPAYFTEYLGSYTSINRRMPEDYLETVKCIDPNNSNYLYWEAGLVIGDAIEKKTYDMPSRRSRRKAPTPPESAPPPPPPPRIVDGYRLKPLPVEQEFVINDRAAYEKAIDLIQKATELPELNNYETTMMRERMRIVRGCNTFPAFIRAITIQFSSSSCGTISLLKVTTVMNARAEELSKSGQREEFLKLSAQRDALMSKLAKSEAGSLVKELVYFAVASTTATNFLAAAERLDLDDLTEKYRKEYDGFVAERDRQELSRYQSSTNLVEKHGATLSRLSLPMMDNRVKSPPKLSDDDIKPLRMAEHELIGRWGILLAALVLSVAALLIFFFRYLVSLPIRNTAKRFAGLLRISDWLWIVGLGIVPSVLFFIYISRYSPGSGRNYGAVYFLFVYPGLHHSVLLLNLLLAPAVVTRWRLKRRAAAFKFGSMFDLLSLPVFVVTLIYSFAAYPALIKYNLTLPVQIGLAAPLVGWLGFAFFNGLRIILGSASARIIQTATSMAVIPAYALAIITLCAILPIYHVGEKFWIPQDKVHMIDPDASDLGAYEFRIAAQKHKETNAILGID